MAPPLAALAGIGVGRGWEAARDTRAVPALLVPWLVLVTAAWQVFIHARAGEGHAAPAWLLRAVLVGAPASAAILGALAPGWRGRGRAPPPAARPPGVGT